MTEGSHLPHMLALPNSILQFAFALGVTLLRTVGSLGIMVVDSKNHTNSGGQIMIVFKLESKESGI